MIINLIKMGVIILVIAPILIGVFFIILKAKKKVDIYIE